uniref:C9orf72-SMCR8 complex subunit n=1 Tax=Astyanax mexicanus TaxID=7994 RepID=A0A8B9K0E0_ASTMX
MSAACPPQSPAVAKTEVAMEGWCPLLAATFAYWDNILGPRVRHIWAPKGQGSMLLSDEKGVIIVSLIFDGELKGDKNTCALSIILPQSELNFYLPLHSVCVERLKHIVRKGRICMQKGYSIIAMLTSEIVPIMELLSSMKTHSVPEEVDIKDTLLNDDDIGDSCHEDFLHKAISSHLQTCGCSIVVGSNPEKVNKIVLTLSLFLTPTERKCSRLCRADGSFKYDTGLFVQGLLKDSTGSFVLPYRQVLYSPYPTTHIDVDINTVKQMPPCHEHMYHQRRYMRAELSALWKAASEDNISPDNLINSQDSFTPDLNIFQDVMHKDTLVKSFIYEVFLLKPGLSLRSVYLSHFLLLLHRKALTLLRYIEDETQKGKKPFRSLRNLKTDLDLTVEGDLNIVMAMAEKLRAGLHYFVFGKPFFTSVQERDLLMSF